MLQEEKQMHPLNTTESRVLVKMGLPYKCFLLGKELSKKKGHKQDLGEREHAWGWCRH